MGERAAIQRLDGKVAVLLDNHPVVVKRSSLPKGAKEGDWLEVEFEGLQVVSATIDMGARSTVRAARPRKGMK